MDRVTTIYGIGDKRIRPWGEEIYVPIEGVARWVFLSVTGAWIPRWTLKGEWEPVHMPGVIPCYWNYKGEMRFIFDPEESLGDHLKAVAGLLADTKPYNIAGSRWGIHPFDYVSDINIPYVTEPDEPVRTAHDAEQFFNALNMVRVRDHFRECKK